MLTSPKNKHVKGNTWLKIINANPRGRFVDYGKLCYAGCALLIYTPGIPFQKVLFTGLIMTAITSFQFGQAQLKL